MNESQRRILEASDYMTIASVNGDGAPWNVPVHFAFDETYIYFRSPVGTTHGANIAKDNRVSAVLFDTSQNVKGAVYVHSHAEKLNGDNESIALETFNKRFNNPPRQWDQTEYYRLRIGTLDEARTSNEMYYFHTLSTQ